MMNPTWYDLLDLEPDATTDEIRAAWKAAIADLEPTDRRFRTLNDAAAVLLDKDKRSAYDADLAAAEETEDESATDEADAEVEDKAEPPAEESDEAAAAAAGEPEGSVATVKDADDSEADDESDTDTDAEAEAEATTAERPVRGGLPQLPAWLLLAVGVLAVASLVAALVVYFGQTKVTTIANDNTTTSTDDGAVGKKITKNHTLMVEQDATAALAAAKRDIIPLLSYDYQSMDASQKKAHAVMTAGERKKYDQLFQLLKQNVPNTKTVVKTLAPVDAGVVRVGDDRVQVLVLVDNNVTNAQTAQPIGYHVFATLTMAKVGDKWLVDNVETSPSDD